MGWQGFGNRKFPRLESTLDVHLKASNGTSELSHAKNIGIGGLCVLGENKYNIYENLHLSFTLPVNQDSIQCQAQVVWLVKTHIEDKERFDIGLEFKGLKKQDKDKIEHYVASLAAAEGYSQKDNENEDPQDKQGQEVPST